MFGADDSRFYKKAELVHLLCGKPIELNSKAAEDIVAEIFDKNPALSGEVIVENIIEHMESWVVLTEEDETNFDTELFEIFCNKKSEFLSKAMKYDLEDTKTITLAEFIDVCQ